MNSIKRIVSTTLLVTILLAGCQVGKQTPTVVPQPVSLPQNSTVESTAIGRNTEPSPEIEFEMALNPLTGLHVAVETLQRRPVMVKVSNYPREGRPHAGLSFADIVFDYYIGYGTNRFLALYYGNDSPQIGPVRSGRLVDAQLVLLYQGILGYGSADEDTSAYLVQALGERAISFEEAPCPAFCGKDTHSVIGVFGSSADITSYAKANNIDTGETPTLNGMVFDTVIPRDGVPVDQINILFNYYNRAEWRYDSTSGTYLRWIEEMEGEEENGDFHMVPLTDRVTGQQLAFNNIIILFAHYIENAPSEHDVELMKNIEGKRAVYYRDGQMFEGIWKVPNDDTPIQFLDAKGAPFALKPGNSWIVLADDNSIFNQKQSGAWELFFLLSPAPE
ncbi:MAG TPA: hypothetical protein DCK95_08885 [Anaerolineaceae bacterium]|nr:hypothetical protein [Anaerolineaceae bacterium]